MAMSYKSGASAVTKHSAGMQNGLSSIYAVSAYAKFLRFTSPNFLVTGPAALVVATISPKSNRTFVDVFMV